MKYNDVGIRTLRLGRVVTSVVDSLALFYTSILYIYYIQEVVYKKIRFEYSSILLPQL